MKSTPLAPLSWKERLYAAYVASGQAGFRGRDPEAAYRPRMHYIKQVIASYLPGNKDANILDLGCGHGAFLYFLAQAGYRNAIGIDTSAEQIDAARQQGIQNALQGDAFEYLCGLQSESVDIVIVFDLLEHLDKQELLDFADQIFRVLRAGGICVAHVPNAEGLQGMRTRFGDLTHSLAFTRSSVRQLFQTIGFSRIECFEERPVTHGLTSIIRRLIWDVGTLPIRLLFAAETGDAAVILSSNLLVRATK